MNDENSANESSIVRLKNWISSRHATPEVSSLLHILLSESPRSCPLEGPMRTRPTFSMDSTVQNFPGTETPGMRITSTVQALPNEEFNEFRMRSALLLSSFCNAYALPVFLLQALIYAEDKGMDLQNLVKVSWELDKGADRGEVDLSDFFQHRAIASPERRIDLYLVTGGVIIQKVLQQYLDARKVTLNISVSGELFTRENIKLFSEQEKSKAKAIVTMSQAMQFFPIYRSILSRRSDDFGMTLAPYNLGVACGVVRNMGGGKKKARKVEMRGYMFVSGRKAEDITKDTFFLSSNHIYCGMLSLHEIDFQKPTVEHSLIPQVLPYACSQFQPMECSSPLLLKALTSRNFAFESVPNEESNCTLLDVIFNPIRPKDSPASSSKQLSAYLTLLVSACEKLIGSNARVMVYVSFEKIIDQEPIEVIHVLDVGTPPRFSDSFLYKHSGSKSMLCDEALENVIGGHTQSASKASAEPGVSELALTLRKLFSGADENFRSQFNTLLKDSKVQPRIDEYLVENKVKVRIVTQECHPQLLSAIAFSRQSPISQDNSASVSYSTRDYSSSLATAPLLKPEAVNVSVAEYFEPPVACDTDTREEHSSPTTDVGDESLASEYPAPLPESGAIPKRYTSRDRQKKVSFDTVEAIRMYTAEGGRFIPVASVRRKSRSGTKKLAFTPTEEKLIEEKQKISGANSPSPVRPNTLPIPSRSVCIAAAATDVPKVSIENLSLQKSEVLQTRLSPDVRTVTERVAGAKIKKPTHSPAEAPKQTETKLKISNDVSSSPVAPNTLRAPFHSTHARSVACVPRISIEGLMYRSKTSPHRFNYDVGAAMQQGADGSKTACPPTKVPKQTETKLKISNDVAPVTPDTLSTSPHYAHERSAASGMNGMLMKNPSVRRSRVSYLGHRTQEFTIPATLVVLIGVSFVLAAVIPAYVFALRRACSLSVPAYQCDATVAVFLLMSVILIIATTAFCEFYLLKPPTVALAQAGNDVPVDPDNPQSALLSEVKCEPQTAERRTAR
ncbi:hypothetical protein [Anaplasma bovis]|uniref:hypothetical protein n=1 Tax=Anaplasma bovis TaxID=186733 RepID=UPI002FF040CB